MTSQTTPYYSDGNLTLYRAQLPVPLPVRKPKSGEGRDPPPNGTPYPHAPFLRAEDERVEVHYTLSNVDDTEHDVWLLVDPWNEFVRWRPGVTVVNADTTVPNLGYDLGFVLPARSRVQGTLTADDMREVSIKLASVENWLASPQARPGAQAMAPGFDATTIANHIFDPQNRSNSGDPLYTPWIPPVVAGLTGFDLGLETRQHANVAVEITIEIQDVNGDRFVIQGVGEPLGLPAAVLSPPSARF
ncbi:MAG: hypothetical protein M3O50_14360 [Myxococcota bacterium]|nr:hypothetical protein [Myxococcota bacterium]